MRMQTPRDNFFDCRAYILWSDSPKHLKRACSGTGWNYIDRNNWYNSRMKWKGVGPTAHEASKKHIDVLDVLLMELGLFQLFEKRIYLWTRRPGSMPIDCSKVQLSMLSSSSLTPYCSPWPGSLFLTIWSRDLFLIFFSFTILSQLVVCLLSRGTFIMDTASSCLSHMLSRLYEQTDMEVGKKRIEGRLHNWFWSRLLEPPEQQSKHSKGKRKVNRIYMNQMSNKCLMCVCMHFGHGGASLSIMNFDNLSYTVGLLVRQIAQRLFLKLLGGGGAHLTMGKIGTNIEKALHSISFYNSYRSDDW